MASATIAPGFLFNSVRLVAVAAPIASLSLCMTHLQSVHRSADTTVAHSGDILDARQPNDHGEELENFCSLSGAWQIGVANGVMPS